MESRALTTSREIVYLSVEKIKRNPYQPRKFFERGNLEELAKSIKDYGVIQPISVRLVNGYNYELVAGERRLRASKIAGLSTIPAIIVNISDQESAILAIIENIQRQNLNFIEEAEGYQNLIQDYSFTQEKLAEKLGKRQSTIANKLRILRLPPQAHRLLIENDLSERHARALLRLPTPEAQVEMLARIIKEGLTVKKTEEIIEVMINGGGVKKKKQGFKLRHCVKDIRIFTNTIKHAVEIMNSSGIRTEYETQEEEDYCFFKIKILYPSEAK